MNRTELLAERERLQADLAARTATRRKVEEEGLARVKQLEKEWLAARNRFGVDLSAARRGVLAATHFVEQIDKQITALDEAEAARQRRIDELFNPEPAEVA